MTPGGNCFASHRLFPLRPMWAVALIAMGVSLFGATVEPIGGAVSVPRTLILPSTTRTWSVTVCDMGHRPLAVVKDALDSTLSEADLRVRIALPGGLTPGLYVLIIQSDNATRRVKIHVDP